MTTINNNKVIRNHETISEEFVAKFINFEKITLPVIKAAFQAADGNYYMGLMLIDSGSCNCILNKAVFENLDDSCIIQDEKMSIRGIHEKGVEFQGIVLEFLLGGQNYHFNEKFYVSDSDIFKSPLGKKLIGIIGVDFLIKHKIVLDYSKEELRISDCIPVDYGESKFYFPMIYGMNLYGLPVVGFSNGEKEYTVVVDSGANQTLMTQYVLDDSGIRKDLLPETRKVQCIDYESTDTNFYKAELSLISCSKRAEKINFYQKEDTVQSIKDIKYLKEESKSKDGKIIPPICGLLSSAFMHRNKWVLDFGSGEIYGK